MDNYWSEYDQPEFNRDNQYIATPDNSNAEEADGRRTLDNLRPVERCAISAASFKLVTALDIARALQRYRKGEYNNIFARIRRT